MANDAPGWTDDGTLGWSPGRSLPPPAPAAKAGPWAPVATQEAETAGPRFWPWRLGVGIAQGLGFFLLFHGRATGAIDPTLFDAAALPLLFVPLLLEDGLGFIALSRLIAFGLVAAAMLAALGWYHHWRLDGMAPSHAGASMLGLVAISLFIAQSFLRAQSGGWRYADLFAASWTLATRLAVWGLAIGLGLVLVNSPLLPRTDLENGDLLAMPLLGLSAALAFQLCAALPRFTTALKDGLVASATIALPLAVTTALMIVSAALAHGPAPLIFLLGTMAGLVVAISASHRGASEAGRRAWRDGFEIFGSLLLPVLAGLAIFTLDARVAEYGWTTARLFAAAATALLAAYGAGYGAAAAIGLVRGDGMVRLEPVNVCLALVAMLAALVLASPLGDPMRLAASAQAARLEQGRVAVAAFDFANLERDSARYGRNSMNALAHSLYPDIARAAQVQGAAAPDHPNPTEIGANIAVRTPGARLPAALLARDWTDVAGVPPCLTRAAEVCDAYFFDLNGDARPEILLVTGNEIRWWGAVMTADAAGRWNLAGRLAAGCGATLSDLRAGRISVLAALPGWSDLKVAGTRLSVTPNTTGCSHY